LAHPLITPDKSVASFARAFELLLNVRPGILASEYGGELSWLKEIRKRDAGRWFSQGLPSRKDEAWKYTSVVELSSASGNAEITLAKDFTANSSSQKPGQLIDHMRTQLPPQLNDQLAGEISVHLAAERDVQAEIIFLNGYFSAELTRQQLPPGVSILVLSELFRECMEHGWTPERLHKLRAFREHLTDSDADKETVFAAINTSFMQDAVLIHVDAGVILTKPIVVSHFIRGEQARLGDQVSHRAGSSILMVSPRLFADLGSRSEVAILEKYISIDSDVESASGHALSFANSVSDIHLGHGSKLSHCRVQQSLGQKHVHIGTTRVRQESASCSEVFEFSLDGKIIRNDLHVSLEGEGAEAIVDGLYLGSGKHHIDNHTKIEHVVGRTSSQQLYKGILTDQARAVFNGCIHIHKDAQKSNSAQLNNNLLLSRQAEIDTKPELEIEADDVKATHGATIGQLDPEHLFYLQARAISAGHAKALLARGFAFDVVLKISNGNLRNCIKELVDAKCSRMIEGEAGR
jgi:Fe-S cluster assembly protein SufD